MFNEKKKEWDAKSGKELEVWQSPKYIEAKEKAIELIKSGKYNLTEGDFWILMNKTKNEKMAYSGLIISHNGCLKINDNMDNKIEPSGFKYEHNGYNNSLIFTYIDNELFEVGEVNKDNCKNDYPYAMAFKRCFDRAVLKKCKLAYAGVYSDSESDEFLNRQNIEEENTEGDSDIFPSVEEKTNKLTPEQVRLLQRTKEKYNRTDEEVKEILKSVGATKFEDLSLKDFAVVGNKLGGN